eukprot:11642340-Alexandrium_andersonii.AAC.1
MQVLCGSGVPPAPLGPRSGASAASGLARWAGSSPSGGGGSRGSLWVPTTGAVGVLEVPVQE